MLLKSWKKSFNIGIVIPAKIRRYDESRGKILWAICDNQVIENKGFEANSYSLKRKDPYQISYMLPYYED